MRTSSFTRGLIPAVAVLTIVATACSGGKNETTAAGDSVERAAGAPIAVTLSDFAIAPSAIRAPAGRALTFEVANEGQTPHTFGVMVGGDTVATPEIEPGRSETLKLDALAAGTYQVLCTVPGHDQLGMTGSLSVADSSAEAAMESTSGGTSEGMSGSPTASSSMSAEQMAEMHQRSVDAFPAETQGEGNQILEPTMDHGVKVFELTATELQWEVAPGQLVDGMAFNGQVPGPEIRVREGDRVRVVLQNQMSQPTSVHFHGLTVPNKQDGVPYITQPPVMPGEYWTYEFTVRDQAGTYVYHSHFNSTEQVGKGLYGAFIVEPKERPGWDVESTLFLGDGPLGYVLNGKSFPATQPIVAERGDAVLIRIANDGAQLHPMHLHGYHFRVVAQDGFALEQPYMADTLVIAPGQRFDVLVRADHPGVWAFHCHILPHVEGPEGMFGMVTALVVE